MKYAAIQMSILRNIWRALVNFHYSFRKKRWDYYRAKRRPELSKKVTNSKFTILANTCIAGVMYNKVGQRFCSPTINLWMYDVEFYKFVNNLDFYLAQDLVFTTDDPYPIALCGDVRIFFNHAKTISEARDKWFERLKRVNTDNLFVIIADRSNDKGIKVTDEQIRSLKNIKCKGKVVFSTRKLDDVDYIVPLSKDKNGYYVDEYMFHRSWWKGTYEWERAFDWIHWLNTGELCRKTPKR